MTKPTKPAPESEEIEMDAMDLEEWERGQSTPPASDAKLTELVKQSAAIPDEPKRPTQTLARVLVKQQQTGLPPEPGSLDAQTVRAPPPTATIIHREREKKPAAPSSAPAPGGNPFDSATVRTPPRVETATVPAPTQTQTPVAANVVARTVTSARTATPPAGTPVVARRDATPAPAKPAAPPRATPPAGIPWTPVIEDSEGWALPDDLADSDWSSLTTPSPSPAAVKPVVATTAARGDATPAPAKPIVAKPAVATIPAKRIAATTPTRGDATPAPRRTQGQPAIARTQTPPAGVSTVTREEGTPRPGPPPMPRTTTQARPAIAREEGTPRPGPPPTPRATQGQPAISRTQTPPAGVPAAAPSNAPASSSAPASAASSNRAVTPAGGIESRSAAVTPVGGVAAQPRSSSDYERDETTTVGSTDNPIVATMPPRRDATPSPARTTMIGLPAVVSPAQVAHDAGPAVVSLDALAAAAAEDDVPELEPSQSGDDLAIPMFSAKPSVVIASEVSEPVRLPEPPQAPAPLPPPPRPRTQPVPVVAAPQPQPQPMIPQAPVLPPTAPVPPASPRTPVAIGTQPLPPSPAAFEPPRDERWNQTDSLPIVRPPMSRALIAIIGGALAVVAIVVIVIATRGPSTETTAKPVIAKHDPEPKGSAEPVGSDTAGSADETGSGSVTEPDPTGTTGTTPTGTEPTGTTPTGTTPTNTTPTGRTPTGTNPTGRTPTGRNPTGRNPTIGKNPKNPIEPTGTVKTGPSAETLAAARASYEAGNSKLFSGDVDGAISAYKQTLVLSPGYAAGYRGLGLAYAQQGNKAKALQALRQYVSAAPNAKDADMIRKRIAGLAGG